MKTLLLMRHAKSSWDDPGLADFERPLNPRGERAAPFMGELMRRRGLIPDLIISSPALRARQTAELVRTSAALDGELRFDENIYEASPHALRETAAGIGDESWTAMLVGHNPGFEGFVRYLTGVVEPMPTAAVAVIELDIAKWTNIDAGSGKLKAVIRPKDLMP